MADCFPYSILFMSAVDLVKFNSVFCFSFHDQMVDKTANNSHNVLESQSIQIKIAQPKSATIFSMSVCMSNYV